MVNSIHKMVGAQFGKIQWNESRWCVSIDNRIQYQLFKLCEEESLLNILNMRLIDLPIMFETIRGVHNNV